MLQEKYIQQVLDAERYHRPIILLRLNCSGFNNWEGKYKSCFELTLWPIFFFWSINCESFLWKEQMHVLFNPSYMFKIY